MVTPFEGNPIEVKFLLNFLPLELEPMLRRPFLLNASEVKAERILYLLLFLKVLFLSLLHIKKALPITAGLQYLLLYK